MRQSKQICDISGLEISRSRRRVLDGPTECYRLPSFLPVFSHSCLLIGQGFSILIDSYWFKTSGMFAHLFQLLTGMQLTSEPNWLETTSVGRNFYCFQTALFVHRYYQTNRSNQHKAVFLLQININKYKTKLFQLEQTGHG